MSLVATVRGGEGGGEGEEGRETSTLRGGRCRIVIINPL